jgi:RNAse (barnase) inhibitor barstar
LLPEYGVVMDLDPATNLPVLVVDGADFDDLAGFAREFSRLLCHYEWTGNLDAFNDVLRGGMGTPDGGFVLRWLHSQRSREMLGHQATVRWLESVLLRCHPSHREGVQENLERARRGEGSTLFDWIVEIVREHGPGGDEAEDEVHLQLL